MNNGALITTQDLVKEYPAGDRKFTALNEVNLTIEKGELAWWAPAARARPRC
jgi:ABC-type dipeptide/oligopeptide/nickel transport system ATPase subunit